MRLAIFRGGVIHPIETDISSPAELEDFLRGFDAGYRGGVAIGSEPYRRGYGFGYQAAEKATADSMRNTYVRH